MQEWIQAQDSSHRITNQVSNRLDYRGSGWELPPENWIKLNFNSSFRKLEHCAGIGWILGGADELFLDIFIRYLFCNDCISLFIIQNIFWKTSST